MINQDKTNTVGKKVKMLRLNDKIEEAINLMEEIPEVMIYVISDNDKPRAIIQRIDNSIEIIIKSKLNDTTKK